MADQNEVSSPNVARATEEHPVKQTQENMQSCKIRFLLPNDTSFTRDFEPQFTIARVKQSLLDDKPPELVEQLENSSQVYPSSVTELRILLLGRFLEDSKTLTECNVSLDDVTTVHLSVKSITSEDPSSTNRKSHPTGCCAVS
uniref:Ubiquitin-like domain-containing protein n=1 Tax=Timspurckia oligopyrenoides TaxID=708627 RepID=A0A7S1ERV6_9RHOD|mmetsp:Transcript_3619/g.6332  ORF Transcript_3619/g.6332 Transcript_3619/m.6332 type:complete len:143 (+) Transcript_3619:150-578(+)